MYLKFTLILQSIQTISSGIRHNDLESFCKSWHRISLFPVFEIVGLCMINVRVHIKLPLELCVGQLEK